MNKNFLAVVLLFLAALSLIVHAPHAADVGLINGLWFPSLIRIVCAMQFFALSFLGWCCCLVAVEIMPQWKAHIDQYQSSGVMIDGTVLRTETEGSAKSLSCFAVVTYTVNFEQLRQMDIQKRIPINDKTYKGIRTNGRQIIRLAVLPELPMSGYSLDKIEDFTRRWRMQQIRFLVMGLITLAMFFALISAVLSFIDEEKGWIGFATFVVPSTLILAHEYTRSHHASQVANLLEEGEEISPEVVEYGSMSPLVNTSYV